MKWLLLSAVLLCACRKSSPAGYYAPDRSQDKEELPVIVMKDSGEWSIDLLDLQGTFANEKDAVKLESDSGIFYRWKCISPCKCRRDIL